MNVGLIDIDNVGKKVKFPNVALMKISAYHKQQKNTVEWWRLDHDYDIVYGSKVFDFTNDITSITNTRELILGGCAYDLENKLPYDIENCFPDYSIYNESKAYGFLTRGCPRNCSFCNVTQHQGAKAIKASDLNGFWNGQKEIVLLDPNLFACKEWEVLTDQLVESGATVDFTQGIDIRVMNKEKIDKLNQIKTKALHFAWDNYEFTTYNKLKDLRPLINHSERNLIVYVLVNFDTTHEQDLERIYKLRDLGYSPYVMVFDKVNASKLTKQVQRWVNNRFIWRTCKSFDDYGKAQVITNPDQLTLF